MNFLAWILLLILPITLSYPRQYSNDFNRFFNNHFKQREGQNDKSHEDAMSSRRQPLFRLMHLNYPSHGQHYPQVSCLPAIWTCGPGLPPCCQGLMCYDGNAKRGRHCVARG